MSEPRCRWKIIHPFFIVALDLARDCLMHCHVVSDTFGHFWTRDE
jgi:hypothetical protein